MPLVQGEAYLGIITDEPPAPGAALFATLESRAAPATGVSVPAEAILWSEGRPIVYEGVSPKTFERRSVTLGARQGDAWIVTEGVAAGENVVTTGAVQLLSAEIIAAEPPQE